jgi:hypothetical protein
MFIYDNESIDGSFELLENHPLVEVEKFSTDNQVNDLIMTEIYNEKYKKYSRRVADWVICVNIDEIVTALRYNLRDVLQDMLDNGVMIPNVKGFQMVNETFIESNKQVYQLFNTGVRDPIFDKRVLFRPEIDINYNPGLHSCSPKSDKYLLSSFHALTLFHYKFFGRDRYINKSLIEFHRLSDVNRENNWDNSHMSYDEANQMFDYTKKFAKKLF